METGGSTKGRKRLNHILERVPIAREQLLAAIEDLVPDFDVAAIQAAAQSPDPRERNKVAVIECELDILISYMEELASRGLAEVQRLDPAVRSTGPVWERLAELRVISKPVAIRLQNVKDMRNELAHAYPVKLADWLQQRGVLD
jgi:hypothetical protein